MKKLTRKQKEVLEKLVKSGIIEKGFYLAGGTALTLKHNHRVSEDFDFFSEIFFENSPFFFLNLLRKQGDLEIKTHKEDTLIFYLEGIRCSFFHYPYKLIRPVEVREGIAIASDEDIAGMKGIAIIQRGTKKDFYDMWFLMKTHNWSLNKIKKICKDKYGNLFSEAAFERAIIYFEDAELDTFREIEPFWGEIKHFFTEAIKRPEVSETFFFQHTR